YVFQAFLSLRLGGRANQILACTPNAWFIGFRIPG
ncbi:MAG: hypothetical protein ACI9HK_006038, partial [Pirellulaceae bacterium]